MAINLYTIPEDELEFLRGLAKEHPFQQIRQRAHLIVMLHSGLRPLDIAGQLSLPVKSIMEAWQSWLEDGITWVMKLPDDLFD